MSDILRRKTAGGNLLIQPTPAARKRMEASIAEAFARHEKEDDDEPDEDEDEAPEEPMVMDRSKL